MIYASFATHANHAHTIQVIDSTLFILNQCFDSMPKNPKERADENRPLFLCSHPALAPFHSARMYAYALPSFKEGERVNMTPVKYHGGRNYKISTYRNQPHAITLSYHPHPRNTLSSLPRGTERGQGLRRSLSARSMPPPPSVASLAHTLRSRPPLGMRSGVPYSLPFAPAPLPLSAPFRLLWRGFAPPLGRSGCPFLRSVPLLRSLGGANPCAGRRKPASWAHAPAYRRPIGYPPPLGRSFCPAGRAPRG